MIRHKWCKTQDPGPTRDVKMFRNFGQQRQRLLHYLTPLKLLSPPYQRICPPWHPSPAGGILFFVVARIDPSPGQSLLSSIPSWEWGEKSYLKALTIFLIVALLFLLLTLPGKWCVTVHPLSVQNWSHHYTTYCFRLRSMTAIKVKYSKYSKACKWC